MAREAFVRDDSDLRCLPVFNPGNLRRCLIQVNPPAFLHSGLLSRLIDPHISCPVPDNDIFKIKSLLSQDIYPEAVAASPSPAAARASGTAGLIAADPRIGTLIGFIPVRIS